MYRRPFYILIFLLLFTPLAFGTVELWSMSVMEILSFLALWLLIKEGLKGGKGGGGGEGGAVLYKAPGTVLLMFFLSYMLLQLIPLPPGLVKFLSPETHEIYMRTVGAEGPMGWLTLALSKKGALSEFFRLAAYGAVYFVTVQCLSDRRRLRAAVTFVVVFATVLSLFSMVQRLLSNGQIYWFREILRKGAFFGPYVNRNHYAGLMEMLYPLILALFLYYKPKVSYSSLRLRFAEILSQRATNIYLLLGLSSVAVATSVFMTFSRGGIISLGLSMVLFGLVLLLTEPSKGRATIILSLFFVVVFAVGWFGWDPVFARFERLMGDGAQADMSRLRLVIWRDVMELVGDFSIFGAGFGSFPLIYPKYRTVTLEQTVNHAHNDYLELLTDGGVVALALAVLFIVTVLVGSFRVFLKRRDGYSRYIFIGSLSGVAAILIHSLVDFNLHNGANGLYFFFMMGLTVSAANTRLHEEVKPATYLTPRSTSAAGRAVVSASVLLILIVSIIFNVASIAGQWRFSLVKDVRLSGRVPENLLKGVRKRGELASWAAPWEARYHFAVASAERLLGNDDKALKRYRAALWFNPLNGDYAQALGYALSGPVGAEGLIGTGVWLDPSNPARREVYVSWLLYQGMEDRALMRAKEALMLAPRMTKDYITLMVLNGLRDDEIASAMPDRVVPHLRFARYLIGTGREDAAEEHYEMALKHAETDPDAKREHFLVIYRWHVAKGRELEALSALRKGARKFPGDVSIKLELARAYERAGITYRAREEYRNVLVLDPKNVKAQRRLDAIQ